MAVRKFNPITPGMRHKVLSKFDNITTDKPHKPLLEPLKKRGGRNNDGKMTMRYRGGGHKRMYRVIDFKRDKHGIAAEVLTIEYDPNRSARIALVEYTDEKQHRGPRGPAGRPEDHERAEGGSRSGQYPLPRRHPARYDDPQHRAASRSRRQHRPLCTRFRPAEGPGWQVCHHRPPEW